MNNFIKHFKKLYVLTMGAVFWFLPAHIIYTYYDKSGGAFWFFGFGWVVALIVILYLDEK